MKTYEEDLGSSCSSCLQKLNLPPLVTIEAEVDFFAKYLFSTSFTESSFVTSSTVNEVC